MTTQETDSSGKLPHEPGSKLDHGKVRPGLVLGDFTNALYEVSRVGTRGAEKYTEHGWLSVDRGVDRYSDAMFRHLMAAQRGEKYDSSPGGTGCLHLAQVAWNALAVLELVLRSSPESLREAPVAGANATITATADAEHEAPF